MKLLVIGGTRFLGRHLVDAALRAGHRVTLMHRGRANPALWPDAEHLVADRNGDLEALRRGGPWDAAVDTCAYVPRHVRTAAQALAGRVGHYLLVSSVSVYADLARPGLDERAALQTLADDGTETVDGRTYGRLKALCEQALLDAMGTRAGIVRPGLLVGPHDPTGRFTWWVRRIERGGEVPCPGPPEAPVQLIDARDAAAFMLQRAEAAAAGVWNLAGPLRPSTFGQLLHEACRTLNPAATLRWIDAASLHAAGVAPWTELPLWVPDDAAGLLSVNIDRARADGLRCRPWHETLLDTAAWAAEAAEPVPAGIGLAAHREAKLLGPTGSPTSPRA